MTVGQSNARANYGEALATAQSFVTQLQTMRDLVDANLRREDMSALSGKASEDEFAFLVGIGLKLGADLRDVVSKIWAKDMIEKGQTL